METTQSINAIPTEILTVKGKTYKEVWDLQLALLNEIIEANKTGDFISNKLLFVEHNPVFTLGKSANETNLLISESVLKTKNIELFKIERGGDITFHGPGQWVVYPIFDLNKFNIGLRTYIEKLETIIINTCKTFGIEGQQLDGLTGVWVHDNKKRPEWNKIAAIGVMCKRFVTMHGFALNVHTDLDYFNLMNPCGITDKGVTTIQQESHGPVDFEEVKSTIINEFNKEFSI